MYVFVVLCCLAKQAYPLRPFFLVRRMENIEKFLATVPQVVADCFGKGRAANYIPALAEVEPQKFGMAISTIDGQDFVVGNAEERFSIQSISKVIGSVSGNALCR